METKNTSPNKLLIPETACHIVCWRNSLIGAFMVAHYDMSMYWEKDEYPSIALPDIKCYGDILKEQWPDARFEENGSVYVRDNVKIGELIKPFGTEIYSLIDIQNAFEMLNRVFKIEGNFMQPRGTLAYSIEKNPYVSDGTKWVECNEENASAVKDVLLNPHIDSELCKKNSARVSKIYETYITLDKSNICKECSE